jgi:hypothetical protein
MDAVEKFAHIDKIFTDFFAGKYGISQLEDYLSKATTAINLINGTSYPKKYNVYVVDTSKKPRHEGHFFMRITPIFYLDTQIFNEIKDEKLDYKDLVERWKNIENWNIEIESVCLDRKEISFNPRELTAMIIHEMAHSVYSDYPIERFYRMFQEVKLKYTLADRAKFKLLSFLYMVPLSTACGIHTIIVGKNGINEEKTCDGVTKRIGYAEDLVSAYNKIIKSFDNNVFDDDKSGDKKVETSIKWTNDNIADFIARKKKLHNEIVYKAISSQSGAVKAMYEYISKRLGVEALDKSNAMVYEAGFIPEDFSLEKYDLIDDGSTTQIEQVMESLSDTGKTIIAKFNKGKFERFSEYDIDAIEVEIDKITNHHDRIFVLDLIYDIEEKLDEIEASMPYNDSIRRKFIYKLPKYRERLSELRKRVLDKHVPGTKYKLFIKVPEGYEG